MIHVVKRSSMPMAHQIAIRVGVIVLALIVCAIVTTLTCGLNPLDVYGTMIAGAVGSTRKVWILLQEAAMLLCVRLECRLLPEETWLNLAVQAVTGAAVYCGLCLLYWKRTGKSFRELNR